MKHKIAAETLQQREFRFSVENLAKVEEIIKQYPEENKQSAALPLLTLAQSQNDNWLPRAALNCIAEILDVSYIKIYEVVSFYTMFNLSPVGKRHIQICGSISCWLNGSDKIYKRCQNILNIEYDQVTKDKRFSLERVECLGACVNAPVAQINNDYYENLDEEKLANVIKQLDNNS